MAREKEIKTIDQSTYNILPAKHRKILFVDGMITRVEVFINGQWELRDIIKERFKRILEMERLDIELQSQMDHEQQEI